MSLYTLRGVYGFIVAMRMVRVKQRFLSILVGLLVVYAAVLAVFGVKIIVEGREEPRVLKTEPREIRLVFVGDIMLSRLIGKIIEDTKDSRFPFLKIASTTEAADIAFANLENPVSTGGVKSGSQYSFRADPKTLEGLKFADFNVVSMANNHIWDYGKAAFLDTLTHLREAGITAVGGGENYDEAHEPKIITVGDTRVAFLAYTNLLPTSLGLSSSTPAASLFNMSQIFSYDKKRDNATTTPPAFMLDVENARNTADFVVVSFHWGEEYKTKHNAEQERIAKLSIDAGAKIIVGHHPHVIQEVEEYNGGVIFYSLGNFIFDQNFSKDTRRGLLAEVVVKGNKIDRVIQKEVAFNDDYQPYLVEQEE